MNKSAVSAILAIGVAIAHAYALPPTERRIREEFGFLCAYKPENGMTPFRSPKCGDLSAIATTPASQLRAEMDAHWKSQTEMRYSELTMLNYVTAFDRAYPRDKEPPPTPAEIHRFDIVLLCDWWRETSNEQMYSAIVERKLFSPKELEAIRRHDLALGMHEPALFCSWGVPDARNRSVSSAGTHVQYVFKTSIEKDRLVYTENGVVTAWQD